MPARCFAAAVLAAFVVMTSTLLCPTRPVQRRDDRGFECCSLNAAGGARRTMACTHRMPLKCCSLWQEHMGGLDLGCILAGNFRPDARLQCGPLSGSRGRERPGTDFSRF